MATTDLHMQVLPFDYFRDEDDYSGSLAQIYEMVREARLESDNHLLFDIGDFLQGNPMGDCVFATSVNGSAIHPMIAAMNCLRYDGATVGNHDFNFGLGFLETALKDANFPVVCANIFRSETGSPWLAPAKILERTIRDTVGNTHEIRIGVIGVAPPQVTMWDRDVLEGTLSTQDIVDSVQTLIPKLREDGADIVIALAHTGIGADAPGQMAENAAVPLAGLDGLDLLLLGHSHQKFPNGNGKVTRFVDPQRGTIHDKPAVSAGTQGNALGVIDLDLQRANGNWKVGNSTCRIDKVANVRPNLNNPVTLAAADAHHATRAFTGTSVGTSSIPLHNYFAQIGYSAAVGLVAQAQMEWAKSQIDGHPSGGFPIVSASAPFKSGGYGGASNYTDIAPGPLSLRNIFDLSPFPNVISAHLVTGQVIRDWIDHAAGQFNQIHTGAPDQLLLDPEFPGYQFDLFFGLDYTLDLTRPARFDPFGQLVDYDYSRVSSMEINGTAVRNTDQLVLVTNNYRAAGGGGYPVLEGQNLLRHSLKPVRDAISEFVSEKRLDGISLKPAFKFAPILGTTAIFETGAQATKFEADIAPLGLVHLGASDQGFQKFVFDFT